MNNIYLLDEGILFKRQYGIKMEKYVYVTKVLLKHNIRCYKSLQIIKLLNIIFINVQSMYQICYIL